MHRYSAFSQRILEACSQATFESPCCLKLSLQSLWEGVSPGIQQIACRLSLQWSEREIAQDLGTTRRQVIDAKRQLRAKFEHLAYSSENDAKRIGGQ